MVRYYRKIIHIRAEDSPNVRLALAEINAGRKPSHTEIVPGVISYDEYRKRRATWDEVLQTIGLDGNFYKGAQTLVFPPAWLNRAQEADRVKLCKQNPAEAIGIDPAEGGDKSAFAVVNRYGLKELYSFKTPDTTDVVRFAKQLMRQHNIDPRRVNIDGGGGGKQHADIMRAQGIPIQMTRFGEQVKLPIKRGLYQIDARQENEGERYEYLNRRAEMYGQLRDLINPSLSSMDTGVNPLGHDKGFALPPEYSELRRQLAPIPLLFDPEGTMFLPPKNKRGDNSKQKSLVEILGCSPDDADATVLAVRILVTKKIITRAGVMVVGRS